MPHVAKLCLAGSLVVALAACTTGTSAPPTTKADRSNWPRIGSGPIEMLFRGGIARATDGSYWLLGKEPKRLPELDGATSVASSGCLGLLGSRCAGSCASLRDGSVRCSGDDDDARLGFVASTTCKYDCSPWLNFGPPVYCSYPCEHSPRVVPGIADAKQIVFDHGPCALRADGSVVCWRGVGADGNPATTTVALPEPATKIASGEYVGACVVLATGKLHCFDEELWGPENRASCSTRECPVRAAFAAITDVVDLDIAGDHGCVVRRDGSAICWGYAPGGALGSGNAAGSLTSSGAAEVESTLSFAAIAVDYWRTCAVTRGGAAACWGGLATRDDLGVVGCGAYDWCRPRPVLIPGLSGVVQIIPASDAYAIALARRSDGSVVVIFDDAGDFRIEPVN